MVLAAAMAMTACGGGGSSTGASRISVVGKYESIVNDHRQGVGCPPLSWHQKLAAAAQSHSDDMEARRYFAHTSPDGVGTRNRLARAGFGSGGENIAAGHGSADQVLAAWLASPGHRAQIENCGWVYHGVGLNTAGRTWTHILAR